MSSTIFGTHRDSEELPTEMATISDEQIYIYVYMCILYGQLLAKLPVVKPGTKTILLIKAPWRMRKNQL